MSSKTVFMASFKNRLK